MATVTAIANHKGGVGKTTTTLNIGAALADRGRRVLLVDLDPQGALTVAMLGDGVRQLELTVYDLIMGREELGDVVLSAGKGVDLLPATIDLAGAEVELLNELGRERVLASKLERSGGQYDHILIDCPPNLGWLTVNALVAAQGVLIPVQTHFLAFKAMQRLMERIARVQELANPRLRVLAILPTFYDPRTVHSREVLEELRAAYGEQVLEPIRVRVALADAAVAGQSILQFDPSSDVSQIYRQMAEVLYD